MQQVTVEVVLRAVFGLTEGERLDHLRPLVVELLERCRSLSTMVPQLRRSLGGRSPWAGLMRSVAAVDEALFAEIRRRRAHPTGGADVLSLLLAARDESGAGLGDRELRDELLTLLVAGHETTATALAFTFERLVRAPEAHEKLVAEVDAGADERYLTATVREALRVRPVLPIVARKLTRDHEVAGRTYARGTVLMPCAWLLHRESDLYPDPERFAPERFLRSRPDTYAWLPFGGGVRRCIGASFAELEMRIVVRSVLERLRVAAPAGQGDEAVVRRSFTFAPEHGGLVVAERRRGALVRPGRITRRELATAA
jgi:cytochrome P450